MQSPRPSKRSSLSAAVAAASALAFVSGCAGGPAAPFDTLPSANLTAYRLQNYEPPAQAAPAAAAPGAVPGLPGLPPQITSWIQQGAAGLEQLVPPGLIPPGMLGQMGAGAANPAAPPVAAPPDAPRFQGFRILGQTPVIDEGLKEELADILGDEDNFHSQHANCMYAEMGLSFQAGPGTQPNDVLLSFSCNQVQSRTFAWPHGATGLKPTAVKKLSEVVNKLWPPGM